LETNQPRNEASQLKARIEEESKNDDDEDNY